MSGLERNDTKFGRFFFADLQSVDPISAESFFELFFSLRFFVSFVVKGFAFPLQPTLADLRASVPPW